MAIGLAFAIVGVLTFWTFTHFELGQANAAFLSCSRLAAIPLAAGGMFRVFVVLITCCAHSGTHVKVVRKWNSPVLFMGLVTTGIVSGCSGELLRC